MMGGGPEDEGSGGSRRGDDDNDYFRYMFRGDSRRSRSEDHEDRFRVDADVKNNRLLLWCNEFELVKVQDLLDNLRASQMSGGSQVVEVHRLVTLDPEPLVKTLQDMETLGLGAQLEADPDNRAIIAYASAADQEKIRELITRLDGSGREFHVISLRRLEADYVAGTVAFMMSGKGEEEKSNYSRPYYYYEYYGRGSSRDQQKSQDEFRVDADIEFNRLLLWANPVEMEEVKNLLVKLGEIPPEGGDASTIRVLDIPPGPEREALLEQLRKVWPSLAPNPLLLPDQPPPSGTQPSPGDAPSPEPPTVKPNKTATEPAPAAREAADTHAASAMHLLSLAQLDQPAASPAAAPESADAAVPTSAPPGQAAAPAAAPARPAPGTSAPVSITIGPDGRLIVSSQDTRARPARDLDGRARVAAARL